MLEVIHPTQEQKLPLELFKILEMLVIEYLNPSKATNETKAKLLIMDSSTHVPK